MKETIIASGLAFEIANDMLRTFRPDTSAAAFSCVNAHLVDNDILKMITIHTINPNEYPPELLLEALQVTVDNAKDVSDALSVNFDGKVASYCRGTSGKEDRLGVLMESGGNVVMVLFHTIPYGWKAENFAEELSRSFRMARPG